MDEYIRTDERQDVVASLEHCALSLVQTRESDGAWKWAILSIHSALQGAMVCHLSGTAELGALTKPSAEQWLKWHESERGSEGSGPGRPPKERVADASELLKRLRSSTARIERQCGAVLQISASQETSFRRIHRLRNEFTHFKPKGWSIEVDYIKASMTDMLDMLSLIARDPWPFRHMTGDERGNLHAKLEAIRSLLSEA